MTHWAHTYIGQAWTPERNCWWLVREAYRRCLDIELPVVPHWRTIRQLCRAHRMRRVHDLARQEFDIVIMRTPFNLHAGLLIVANGRIGVLHSARETGVVFQPWLEAVAGTEVELWRRI